MEITGSEILREVGAAVKDGETLQGWTIWIVGKCVSLRVVVQQETGVSETRNIALA